MCLMKEETGHRRREVSPPLVIFDPLRSSSLSRDTTCRSCNDINGNHGVDHGCHKGGNSNHKKSAKASSIPKKVSF